jgi:hypothetical protein
VTERLMQDKTSTFLGLERLLRHNSLRKVIEKKFLDKYLISHMFKHPFKLMKDTTGVRQAYYSGITHQNQID